MLFLLFFIVIGSSFAFENIVSLKCGQNNVFDNQTNQFYSFNKEVTEGVIEFAGNLDQHKTKSVIYLYRGIGDFRNFNYNVTLWAEFKPNEDTQFYYMNLNNIDWSPPTKTNARPMTTGKHRVKIEILKDRYDIWFDGTFLQSYKRVVDVGYYLKAAAVSGDFFPSKIDLQCKPSNKKRHHKRG